VLLLLVVLKVFTCFLIALLLCGLFPVMGFLSMGSSENLASIWIASPFPSSLPLRGVNSVIHHVCCDHVVRPISALCPVALFLAPYKNYFVALLCSK
jgi:hypothetical protein